MPSFDVVSKVTMNEVDNALNQANKELGQRFDFRGSNTSIKLVEAVMTVESADEFKVKAAVDVLREKLAKRKVPLEALDLLGQLTEPLLDLLLGEEHVDQLGLDMG